MTGPHDSRGALTGATGDLTPDDADMAFVPGERREVSDADHQADVTTMQGAQAPSQSGEVGSPGADRPEDGPTELADRESGYGSEHGLSPEDPAYRMEARPRASTSPSGSEPRIGGDNLSEEEEHL
jgi:hypothetical protein